MGQSYQKFGGGEPAKLGSSLALRAGLAASLMGMPLVGTLAQAQEAADDNVATVDETGDGALLEQVVVGSEGLGQLNTNAAASTSSRLPGTVRDVPQTVNTVPERVMIEQNVTTLEQALANVPGITVMIGEGNGGMNGDRFRIRGFESAGDNYRDGLRDFGVYVRDSFNIEQVQVYKGPNGENFGVGTTGGAINTSAKRARLGTFGSASISAGSGDLVRPELDYNWQFHETSALRVNVMGNWQDVIDRKHSYSDRWGVAASLGLGLGTEQTLHIDYMYQHNDRKADYGIPFVRDANRNMWRPVTEYGIPRNTYYGKQSDRDDSDIHMLTASYTNEINEWLTVHNDTRYARFDRWFSTTGVSCGLNGAPATALQNLCWDILGNGVAGNPTLNIGAGGGSSYEQSSWSIQNVTTGIAKFETGGLRHEAIFGLDIGYQDDERYGLMGQNLKKPPHLWPDADDYRSDYYTLRRNPDSLKDSDSHNIALFASDRVWLNEQWSIMGGLRWEKQKTNYRNKTATGITHEKSDVDWVSPKASIIWEPTDSQNYYFSWSVANNLPSGQYVNIDTWPVSGDWKPEKTHLYELGTKLDFFDGNLGITAAVFHLEKENSLIFDPVTGDVSDRSGEKQRVVGFEAGLTGQITANWNVYASYAYLKSKILDADLSRERTPLPGMNGNSLIGHSLTDVPKHAATLWTTYDIAPHLDLEGKLLIGGGMRYRDALIVNRYASIPHSFAVDAMVSYEAEKWNLSLNAYNLTDRLNYDTYFSGNTSNAARAIPSSGRSFVVKLGTKF